jgi:protein-S-isoprenylcysteine O-methyltransferase Ste14
MSILELKISPVLLSMTFALAMWWVSRETPGIPIPAEMRIAALAVFGGAGLLIGTAGVMAFRKARTTVNPFRPEGSSSLVVSGIYRVTRNPMYLGLMLALTGWGLFLANVFALAIAAGYAPYINRFQILPEERALKAAFGTEFLDYRKRVRKWL